MAVMAAVDVDGPVLVKERLEAFASQVLAQAVNRPVQLVNGALYLRGLLEQGQRKSLEPLVARLGGEADYESMQQFLAVSTWDPARVVRATAERVAPAVGVEAWVLDDTGFLKRRHAFAGGQAPVLGHVGEDRQLPDRGVGARCRQQGHGAVGLGAVSARGVVSGRGGSAQDEDP